VLELYVQVHEDRNSGNLVIELSKTLGLTLAQTFYRVECAPPVSTDILAEVESAFSWLLEINVTDRWGVQTSLLPGD
jgi:hypothetical protein